jgi:hypothetical protein
MAKLFTKLTEEFDSHAGEMIGYVDLSNVAYTTKKHYDIRSFHTDDITVPRTMIDMNYWNSTAFDGTQMAVLDAPRIVIGRSIAARQMSLVDVLKNQDLNQLQMRDLDLYTIAAGNENWPLGDPDVTVGKDATERYANVLAVNLKNGIAKTVTSSYRDNIVADFQEAGHSYFIEIPLPNLSAQQSFGAGTPVTTTGNEITDATRTAATALTTTASGNMVDQYPNDSSFGIFRAATNVFVLGQAGSIGSIWSSSGAGATPSTDATVPPPYSTQSIKYVCDGTVANQGCLALSITGGSGLPATTGTFGAGSIWFKGVAGQSYFTQMRWINTDASTTDGTQSIFTATGAWQLLTPASVAVAATKTGNQLVIMVRVNGTRTDTFWVAHAMLEVGQSVVAPYVATSGGATATHAAGRVQATATNIINSSQGWFAVRIRYSASRTNMGFSNLIYWGDASNYINLHYESGGFWYMETSANSVNTAPVSFAANDFATVIGKWSNNGRSVGISINGVAFTTASTIAGTTNVTQTTFNLGTNYTGANPLNGDILWFACGSGTLTDADATTIHGFGNTDPSFSSFPITANTTMEWTADTTATRTTTGTVDLYNSYIDFSSDASYASSATDSLRFADSLNSISAGGNTYLRFNRNSITHADLSNLTNIRFRLQSTGNMTFKAQNIRLIRDDYVYDVVDIDTKRNQWRRSVPRDSGTEPSGPSSLFMTQTKPKNARIVAKFNSGHLDATNRNVLLLSARKSSANDTRVYVQLESLSGSTSVFLRDRHTGVDTTINTTSLAALTPTTDYYLVLDVYENKATASIYTAFGAFLGTLVGTTGAQTTTVLGRGYIGFNSQPYNYDFTLDYVTVGDAEFARFEGTSFGSFTPVTGATISGNTSLPVDLGEGHYVVAGDATLVTEPTIGLPAPSAHFTRDGTGWQGGYMTDQFLFVGNPKYLTITGDIYPVLATGQTALRGEYRVVLLDKNDAVGYIGVIRGLLPNQWNNFTVHVNANFAPGNYRLILQQTGFYADEFFLDNLKLNHLSIAWEASPNGGTDWFPFLSATGSRYSGANMITKANQSLKFRAIALSDLAWVADYEAIPKYGYPGR